MIDFVRRGGGEGEWEREESKGRWKRGGKGEGGLEPVKEKQRKYGTGELISAGASIIPPWVFLTRADMQYNSSINRSLLEAGFVLFFFICSRVW